MTGHVSTPEPAEQRETLEGYGTLGASLTLNLTVQDIGAVISLLTDAGYEVEVNVTRPCGPRSVPPGADHHTRPAEPGSAGPGPRCGQPGGGL